jgi:hypothetical protein
MTDSTDPPFDPIFDSFLQRQFEAMEKINTDSDIVVLRAQPREIPRRYIAQFHCTTMVRRGGREPELSNDPIDIGINFSATHLRKAPHPSMTFTLLQPLDLFHPNFLGSAICTTVRPGAGLNDMVFNMWTMLTFQSMRSGIRTEHPLNRDAATWCNRNLGQFPTDTRPLFRRTETEAAAPVIEFSEA